MAERRPEQTIDLLRKRFEELNSAKITANADYKNARKQLDDLKAEALANYQTDDLETLKSKLKEMEAENQRKLTEYQAHLDKIDLDLKEVEQKFAQPREAK